jgi:hypothetical protein
MSVAPVISWQSLTCEHVPFGWHASGGSQWSGLPVALGSHSNAPLAVFNVATAGSAGFTTTGVTTLGSNTITGLNINTGLLAVGQAIGASGIPAYSWISSLNIGALTLVFRNGFLDTTSNDMPATFGSSGVGIFLHIADPCPIGTLLTSVSPSTGVTITDDNFDGPTDIDYRGDGSAICNLSGFADGNFSMAFASAGTFVVECMFVTADPNYSNVTLSPPITIVVT